MKFSWGKCFYLLIYFKCFLFNYFCSNLSTFSIYTYVNFRVFLNKFNIIDLVIISKLEKSKSVIRRLIKGNAIKLDDKIISDEKLIITNKIFKDNYLKLSIGKKRHIKIELN